MYTRLCRGISKFPGKARKEKSIFFGKWSVVCVFQNLNPNLELP